MLISFILNVLFGGRNIFSHLSGFSPGFLYYLVTALLLMMVQLVEKQRLIEFAEALRSRLNYFDELENVSFGKHSCHIILLYEKKTDPVNSCSVIKWSD